MGKFKFGLRFTKIISHLNRFEELTKLITLILLIFSFVSTQAQNKQITVHLRGVYESKISLLPLSGPNTLKPILVLEGIKNGGAAVLKVPDENIPGEFVLRFDYKDNLTSTLYPSEKRIIIYNQDLELWVHPVYCNNPDSTWFRKDERENTSYARFLVENSGKRAMLGLLQDFLLNYDNPNSSFYKKGINEYEIRRKTYNIWINEQIDQDKNLFVSNLFGFQHIPEISWEGTDAERKQSLRDNYFEEIDFSKPLMVRTTGMKEWMDGYVNLFGELATSIALRDSLFTHAGENAIEKARHGDPLVYGWMVDYFFNGYESFNIQKGIKMLEPYLDDPNCLTSKRQEINRRLTGMESLVPGTLAPEIIMQDAENNPFVLSSYMKDKDIILLLFWSADCSHCKEMVDWLYPWYQQPEVQKKLDIVDISMDETEKEIEIWQHKITGLKGWVHLRAAEGLRSQTANDYYILGVPVMILIDAKTQKIISLPENPDDLNKLLGL